VFVDILLENPVPDLDGDIAAAAERSWASSTPVFFAVDPMSEGYKPPGSPSLAKLSWLASWGFQERQLWTTDEVVRAPVELCTPGAERATVLHAAVALVAGGRRVTYETDARGWPTVRAGDTSNHIRMDGRCPHVYVAPVAAPPVVEWNDPGRGERVEGRFAIVGVRHGGVDEHRTPWGLTPGVDLHASLVQTLLDRAAPLPPSRRRDGFATFVAGALTLGLGEAIRPPWRFACLLAPAAFLAFVWYRAAEGYLWQVLPFVLAGLLAYEAVRARSWPPRRLWAAAKRLAQSGRVSR
jgi:hypothetical protein